MLMSFLCFFIPWYHSLILHLYSILTVNKIEATLTKFNSDHTRKLFFPLHLSSLLSFFYHTTDSDGILYSIPNIEI